MNSGAAPPSRLRLLPFGIPRLYVRYLRGDDLLSTWLGVNSSAIATLLSEFRAASPFADGFHPLRNPEQYKAAVLYAVCRIRKPRLVIETGVASGTSSVGILSALHANGRGNLISVDLPGAQYVTESGQTWRDDSRPEGPGWRVSPSLRSRWTLRLGSSRSLLPGLIADSEVIDLFYHDSEHTKSNMDFELDWAWSHLDKNGCTAVDNANWTDSFSVYCSSHSLTWVQLFPFLGLARGR